MSAAQRAFSEFRSSGLLWLFNASVLHPRGYAMALHYPEGATLSDIETGNVEPIGWSIMGNGTEPWMFVDAPGTPESETINAKFQAVLQLFVSCEVAEEAS